MQLDIRTPMALMFGILGALLTVFGMIKGSDPEMLKRSLGININLWWGIVLLIFAASMYLWSRTGRDTDTKP